MTDNRVIVVPLVIAPTAFKALNEAALLRGKTVAAIICEALEEKVEAMKKEKEKNGTQSDR